MHTVDKRERKFYLKKVIARVGRRAVFLALMITTLLFALPSPSSEPQEAYPGQKPKYDYMSTYWSRNTKPLGLKEDKALQKLLKQPSIIWAIRAGARHILD